MINGTLHCRTMALLVSRLVFCPTTGARPKGFALRRELEVGRYRLVPPTSSRQTRIAATVAPLAFPLRREAYHPENSRHRRIYWSAPPCDVPPAIVLETGPVIYKSHNGFWFLVQSNSERTPPRPTGSPQEMLAGLGHHSQTQSGPGLWPQAPVPSGGQNLCPSAQRTGLGARHSHACQILKMTRSCPGDIAFILEIAEVASGNHLVVVDQFVSLDIRRRPDPFIDWVEILIAIVQQLLETVDYKIGWLKGVDHIFRAHDTLKIEANSIGRVAF